MRRKRCKACRRVKPAGEFYRDPRSDTLYARCKPCHCEALRAYRAQNRDRIRQRERRTMGRAHKDDVTCVLCGARFSMLGPHLKLVHGTTAAAYRQRFGAPTSSPRLRAVAQDRFADRTGVRVWRVDEMAGLLRRCADELGCAPSSRQWERWRRRRGRQTAPATNTIVRHLGAGSWTVAVQAAIAPSQERAA